MAINGSVCGSVVYLTLDVIGLGFESCDADCYGASGTDALLAVHALYSCARLVRRLRQQRASQRALTNIGCASHDLLNLSSLL